MNNIINGIIAGLRYVKNQTFRNWVEQYGKPTAITFCQNGDCLFGTVIYYIGMKDLNGNEESMGFFALFNCVLNRLYYADRLGFVPYVEWPDTVLYYDKEFGNNVWEYYFKPVSELQSQDVMNAYNLVISHEKDSQFNLKGKPGYLLDEEGIKNLSLVLKKYISLNDNLKSYIEKSMNQLNINKYFGKGLAVHIRGTDFYNVNKNHPKVITIEQYIEKIKELFNRNKYNYIFLATDENLVIKRLEEEFGIENVYYYEDTLRSNDGLHVHKSSNNRLNHKYLLGCEILRDMYTLAKCDGFIAGMSQVSLAVRILKKSWNEEWYDLQILNNGIYK